MQRPCVILCLTALLAACADQGDPGPMGPAGPPGTSVRGVSYVAHFDRLSDLDTWLYTDSGEWRVENGELVVRGVAGELVLIGPSTEFAGDLDLSVRLRALDAPASVDYGLRFHADAAEAYWLTAAAGAVSLVRIRDGVATTVVEAVPVAGLASRGSAEVEAVVRDRTLSLYIDGVLSGRAEDLGPRRGRLQVYVRGAGEIAFDELWVHTALPLE